jgi:ferredoxin, 2Fe-2S
MPKITYVQHDGSRSELDVPAGQSIMKAAIANDVDGIIADCGGSLSCATCHVYVAQVAPGAFPPPAEEEQEMLEDTASERRDNSRLSCQLTLTDDMDEVVIELPEDQW